MFSTMLVCILRSAVR